MGTIDDEQIIIELAFPHKRSAEDFSKRDYYLRFLFITSFYKLLCVAAKSCYRRTGIICVSGLDIDNEREGFLVVYDRTLHVSFPLGVSAKNVKYLRILRECCFKRRGDLV